MKPIIFRIWDSSIQSMDMEAIGEYSRTNQRDPTDITFSINRAIAKEIKRGCDFMQYIGEYDKEGEKIFELDILRGDDGKHRVVVFNNGSYKLYPAHNFPKLGPGFCTVQQTTGMRSEIIGNIYQGIC